MNAILQNKTLNRYQLAKLHTFEVCARHQSFALAAQELNLTASAVSHQISHLENDLKFNLFKRFHRHIELSDEGRKLFITLQELLYKLNQEVIDIKNQEISGQLDIYCRPSIAQCLLLSRLHKFTEKHPHIKLNLSTGNELIDFNRHKIDLAIYYDDMIHEDIYCKDIMNESITPVCSSEYARKHHLIGHIENLPYCTFLHDSQAWEYNSLFNEWEYWTTSNNLRYDFSQLKYCLFDRSDLAINAAINGMGIALGRKHLIEEDIKNGKLCLPFKQQEIKCRARYYILTPHLSNPKVHSFIKWVCEEGKS